MGVGGGGGGVQSGWVRCALFDERLLKPARCRSSHTVNSAAALLVCLITAAAPGTPRARGAPLPAAACLGGTRCSAHACRGPGLPRPPAWVCCWLFGNPLLQLLKPDPGLSGPSAATQRACARASPLLFEVGYQLSQPHGPSTARMPAPTRPLTCSCKRYIHRHRSRSHGVAAP